MYRLLCLFGIHDFFPLFIRDLNGAVEEEEQCTRCNKTRTLWYKTWLDFRNDKPAQKMGL